MIILSAIKSIDIFGRPICLNYKSRDYFRSYLGGFTTVALLTFLIIYSRNGIENILSRENVKYNLITSKSDNPDQIQLNLNKFMFAIRIQQTNFLSNPFLNLTVIQTNQTLDSNGKSNRTLQIIRMVPCTVDHWKYFLDSEDGDFQTTLNRYSINDALCPSIEDSQLMSIQGTFYNSNFNYVKIAFSNCINNSTNCKTEQELQQQINSTGQIRAQIFFPSVTINPSQQQYYKKSIDDNYQFTFIPNSNVVTSDIFVQTDDSLIISTNNNIKEDIFTYIENRFNTQYQSGKKNGNQAVFFLRRSQITYKYERSFKSIQSFLSELGGIAQVFISSLGIFFFMFYGILFKVQLINELYDIDLKSKKYIKSDQLLPSKDTDQQNQTQENNKQQINNNFGNKENIPLHKKQPINVFSFENTDEIIEQKKVNQNDANQSQSPHIIQSSKNQNKKSHNQQLQNEETLEQQLFSPCKKNGEVQEKINLLWIKFNNMINQYQKVKLSFKLFLHMLTCKKYFKDKLFPLLKKSLVHINEDLDISTILYKLQEIEKLKTVLLDENQRNLFSFFPKPLIRLNEPLQRKQSYHGSPKLFLNQWKSKIYEDIKLTQKTNESPANKNRKKSMPKKEETQQQHLFSAQKNFTQLDSFRALYQAYLHIIQAKEIAPTIFKTNERLINSLGKELLEIFKIQNEENHIKIPYTQKYPSKLSTAGNIQRKLFRNLSSGVTDSISVIEDDEFQEQKQTKTIDNNHLNNENKFSDQFNVTNINNFTNHFYFDQNNKTEIVYSNQDTKQDINSNQYPKNKNRMIFKLQDMYSFKNKINSKNIKQQN